MENKDFETLYYELLDSYNELLSQYSTLEASYAQLEDNMMALSEHPVHKPPTPTENRNINKQHNGFVEYDSVEQMQINYDMW